MHFGPIHLILCGIFFTTLAQSLSINDLYKEPLIVNNWILSCIHNFIRQIRNLLGNFCPNTTQDYLTTSTISSTVSNTSNLPLFAIADTTGMIKVYSQNFLPIINFTAHDETIERLLSIPNKGILVSCSDDTTVKLWNTTDWSLIRAYKKHSDQIWAIEYLEPDLIVSASFDLTTQFWNLNTGETIMTIKNNQPITCLRKLSKNLLAGGDFEDVIYLWDLNNSFKLVAKLTGQGLLVDDIVLVNEKVIATANDDFSISFWDIENQSRLTTFKAHSSNVNAIKLLSPNLIVSASADGLLKIWSFSSFSNVTLVNTLVSHQRGIIYALDLLISNSGDKYIISGSLDETVKIWKVGINNSVDLAQTILAGQDITALATITIQSSLQFPL